MTRRPEAALLAALLAACGSGEATAPPPAVSCGATASSGALVVNAPSPTCGAATGFGTSVYAFTSGAAGTSTVTLWTTSGDADLHVYDPGGALVGYSVNMPPTWVDQVAFQAAAATTYTVEVSDVNPAWTGSTYAVQVTGP